MKFALLILCSPESGPVTQTALRFARALLASDHELQRIFLFAEGVYQAQCTARPGGPEPIASQWADIAMAAGAELIACSSSASKRGVLDRTEADRNQLDHASLHPTAQIGGLGLLHESLQTCDRVISFGVHADV